MMPKFIQALLTTSISLLFLQACNVDQGRSDQDEQNRAAIDTNHAILESRSPWHCADTILLPYEVRVGRWYLFLDSLVEKYDTILNYKLRTEHILHANPWILDTLVSSDYDIQKGRDSFIHDNRTWIVVRAGQKLCIPDSNYAAHLQQQIDSTWLDINIPEFRMRIVRGGDTLHAFKVRVGQVRVRHLDLAGGNVDLRTRTGEGKIIRVETDPLFLNPVTAEKFTTTRRDDGKRTEMPLIPWIEPEINRTRYGQLIHPTTNPSTLGKAYSNGCIGATEADAWRVYFYAPVGTRVKIRYDLDVVLESGDTVHLKDIYGMKGRKSLPPLKAPVLKPKVDTVKRDS